MSATSVRPAILSLWVFMVLFIWAPLHASEQPLEFDDEFINLVIEESESIDDAVENVNRVCRQEEMYVRYDFNQEKNKIARSLDSLGRGGDRRSGVNKALRKLNQELSEVHEECVRARKVIARKYPLYQQQMVPPAAPTPVASAKNTRPTLAKPKAKKPASKKQKPLLQPAAPPRVVAKPPEPVKEQNLQIHGTLINSVAYRIDKPHEFTKNRYQALLQESFKVGDQFRVKTSQRAFFDSVVHDFNKGIPKGSTTTEKNDLESEFEFREAYVDGSFGDVDMRLGLQQIVWGEAVGVFVADTVNGRDLREYILPDFDWIRRPQWSLDLINTKDAVTVEGVVSLPEFDKLGTRGSEFEFPFPVPAGPYVIEGPDEPDASLSNSDFGGRLGYLVGGLDLGLFFLHTWNKFPVIKRELTAGTLHLTPSHERMDILGLTFSRDAGEAIVKGEATLRPNQPYSTADPLDTDGIEKNMTLEGALGVDRSFGRLDTNVQVLQKFVANSANLIGEESSRTHFSLWLKTDLFRSHVTPEILAIVSPTIRDNLYRPKITFKLSDAVLLKTGVDIFDGKPGEGLFGIFDGKSRTYSELEYHF